MPQIIDNAVINKAYSTEGNGSRKLVMLENGWLVVGVIDTSTTPNTIRLYKSENNGVTWIEICNIKGSHDLKGFSMVSKGNMVYLISPISTTVQSWAIDATTVTNTNIYTSGTEVDILQSDGQYQGVSLTTNPEKTRLFATWSSKNSTYPKSFNIRYAEGPINADGSVTWRTVETVTRVNTAFFDFTSPSILIDDRGIATIVSDAGGDNVLLDTGYTDTVDYAITIFKRDLSLQNNQYLSPVWTYKNIYLGGSNTQSSPSAIFVPNVINGLPKGRFWVTWQGQDSVDTTVSNIRVAYSDDSGESWVVTKVTSGNTFYNQNPTITASKDNKVFIVFSKNDNYSIQMVEYVNGAFSEPITLVENAGNSLPFPSTLVDLSLEVDKPLLIYRNTSTSKVGFYGTWGPTEISVPQGDLGIITDGNNLLTYSITNDKEMTVITEKVNGIIVGTKNLTSEETTTVSLSQSQWDAVPFGKYANASGNPNTLEISMGAETWTYTFEKNLDGTADIISSAKAVKDYAEIVMPTYKNQLASAIQSLGGNVSGVDSFEDLANSIKGITLGKKWASGEVSNGNSLTGIVTIRGLDFKPSLVICHRITSLTDANRYFVFGIMDVTNPNAVLKLPHFSEPAGAQQFNIYYVNYSSYSTLNGSINTTNNVFYDDGFKITSSLSDDSFRWATLGWTAIQ